MGISGNTSCPRDTNHRTRQKLVLHLLSNVHHRSELQRAWINCISVWMWVSDVLETFALRPSSIRDRWLIDGTYRFLLLRVQKLSGILLLHHCHNVFVYFVDGIVCPGVTTLLAEQTQVQRVGIMLCHSCKDERKVSSRPDWRNSPKV